MGGMRKTPANLHREVIRREESPIRGQQGAPAEYRVWLGVPHAPRSEVLGTAERLVNGASREWRGTPASAEWPRIFRGYTSLAEWFIEIWEGRQRVTEDVLVIETESVRVLHA